MENKILLTQEDKEEFVFWIETLKASVLPQGKIFLEDFMGNYCCLGVAQACSAYSPKIKNHFQLEGSLPSLELGSPEWLVKISEMSFSDKKGKTHMLYFYNDTVRMPHPKIAKMVWNALKHELKGFK